jgi:hypothetical protein
LYKECHGTKKSTEFGKNCALYFLKNKTERGKNTLPVTENPRKRKPCSYQLPLISAALEDESKGQTKNVKKKW